LDHKHDNSVPDVTVVDSSRRFLGYTRRGKARILVNSGKAKWLQLDPPVLEYRGKPPGQITYRRSDEMETAAQKSITNWTEFFKTPRDIFVQNVSNCQVSIEFETTPGNKTGFLFPQGQDPVNLTQFIPFDAIKASIDFRKMLNRRPPALSLMTEEEFMGYYTKKAEELKKPVEKVIDESAERLQRLHNKQEYTADKAPEPIHRVVEDDPHFGGKKRVASTGDVVTTEEVIHPRVLHLCQQVNTEIPDPDKMRAHVMLGELQSVERDLRVDDWEYVRSHGYWKTVKNYARDKISQMANAQSGSEGAEDTFAP